ncbi:uncharacterized protein METZ01_LOCUS46656 [marine metagenome]|uniref:Uncharacterized protein n=1 Tax=marine metagenome TaxID=408172 RepID=A0A381RPH8_9ZZZZ
MIESGTKGADIASAATVVIGTDGSYFDITGTTGISTQFTVDAGRRFTLQFNGAVTITDNAAITLSGAANFTTAAGDILSFVATAANTVVQTGYSLVDGGSPIVASSDPTYLQFPATQVASADANRLDDYEEGTFTVTFACNTGTITIDTAYDTGHYVKIGRLVHINGFFLVSSVSSPAVTAKIHGLPFTPGGTVTEGSHSSAITVFVNSTLTGSPIPGGICGYTWTGYSYLNLVRGGADSSNNTASFFTAATYVGIGGTYLGPA